MINFQKVVIILRHVSGAGSSTFAEYLQYIHTFGNPNGSSVICEADDAMYENGEYVFKTEKLGMAHTKCREKFENALKDGANLVICSNTNTKLSEFSKYIEMAENNGYTIFTVVLENRQNTQNLHKVPQETLDRQAKNIYNSLKLI